MSIFKCKMCGGSLEVQKGQTICECEYCGTKQTVSATDDEVVTNLYNRANNLRIKCEFDKAQEIYEKIVAKNPNEAEAYWGIVLCKYGIEYVEDPNTYKRVPTCHRTQLESVLTDVDYLSAMENADSNQRLIYEQEAKEIDKLQKDILSIVHNEKSFDVFICYKETDENGKRTVDSVLANDIYYQLTQEGLKVFYAAITLENKLGQEYEPYIFSALNSAKVMLVVGTKPENFNAIWVKNEWSRYLKLMSNDRSKTLIPCFRDMDAYDLPDEFSHLQAQDMGKIGFINDVVRGIKKLIAPVKEQPTNTVVVESNNTDIAPLLKRALIFLEDGNWKDADEYCERVLDLDPENSMAYLGKLMAELKVHRQDDLAKLETSFDENDNYKKAIRYANKDLSDKLKSYIDTIRNTNDEKMYQLSLDLMKSAKTEEDFNGLAESFDLLEDYKDSKELAREFRRKAEKVKHESIYLNAIKLYQSNSVSNIRESINEFNKIVDYKDVNDIIKLAEDKLELRVSQENKRYLERKRKTEITCLILVVLVIIIFAFSQFIYMTIIRKNVNEYLENNQTAAAYSYYLEHKSYLNDAIIDEIAKNCVINNDFETLLDKIDYDKSYRDFSLNIEKIVEENISQNQYDNYYSNVLKYHDIGNNDLRAVRSQCRLLSFFPDDYKNIKEIKAVSDLLASKAISSESNIYKDVCDEISDYCSYYQISEYLVANSEFMVGKWSDSDGEYVKFSYDNDGGHCSYSIPAPSNSYHYDYYRIVDGKYQLYVKDDKSDNIDVFKMTLKSKDKMEVYSYINGKTYTMTR